MGKWSRKTMAKVKRLTCASIIITITIILISSYCLIAIIYYESKTLIKTKSGILSGLTVNRLGKNVNCYYGIPYAEPPIKELRFRKPQPKKPWKGLLKAAKLPNQCMQQPISSMPDMKQYSVKFQMLEKLLYVPRRNDNYSMSEDCLYLNIFVSADTTLKSNKTVMVWIHGGAFIVGSINDIEYDGSVLAAFADVIIVTINYRLGIFGYLIANHSDLRGNYGLHDQVMALQWVKTNIYSFGGNPNNIVIFGESAGAMSVSFHLISPLSQNLFKRAILQSGNALNLMFVRGRDYMNEVTIDVIRDISCPLRSKEGINTTLEITKSSLTCLKQVNASALLSLQMNYMKKGNFFIPTDDEDFFGGHPFDLVKAQKFNSNVEIIIGSNSDEGVLAAKKGPLEKFWLMDKISPNFTRSNILKTLEKLTPEANRPLLSTAIDSMFEGIDDENDYVKYWNRYIKTVVDIAFVCPDYVFIHYYSLFGGKVYYYQFKAKSFIDSWSPKWSKGASHADEIPFIFGFPLVIRKKFKPQDIEFTKSIMKAWTEFSINGNSNFGNNSWLQYIEEEPHYMSFDLENITLKTGFPTLKCDEYYEDLYNGVRAQAGNKDIINQMSTNYKTDF